MQREPLHPEPGRNRRSRHQDLPQSLKEAADALEADPLFREVLGAEIVDEFIRLKRMEWVEYSRHVSDWEIQRYTEFF